MTTATYAPNTQAPKAKVPGKAGAIARLAVLWIFAVISFCGSFFTIPTFAGRVGLWQAIVDSLAGFGTLLLTGAFLWCIMKWVVFIFPKSFGLGKRFWQSWIPLTFLGLYLKFAVFCLLALVPITASFALFSPLMFLVFQLSCVKISILGALPLLAAGVAAAGLCSLLDVCKLRKQQPMVVLRAWIKGRKEK